MWHRQYESQPLAAGRANVWKVLLASAQSATYHNDEASESRLARSHATCVSTVRVGPPLRLSSVLQEGAELGRCEVLDWFGCKGRLALPWSSRWLSVGYSVLFLGNLRKFELRKILKFSAIVAKYLGPALPATKQSVRNIGNDWASACWLEKYRLDWSKFHAQSDESAKARTAFLCSSDGSIARFLLTMIIL